MAAPAGATEDALAIRAGKILTLTGAPITGGVLLIRGGKITAVGKDVRVPAGVRVVDASTKVVMPGLVAAFSTLGEEGDAQETVTPRLRASESFDFYKERRQLLRGGVTTLYVASGLRRLVSGQGAVLKPAGDPRSRMLLNSADLRVILGDPVKSPPALFRPPLTGTSDTPILPAQRQLPTVRPAALSVLRQLFADARRPAAKTGAAPSPELAALLPVLNRAMPLRVNAHRAVDIQAALRFADEQKVRLLLEGATEAYRLAGEIARRKIPVVVQVPARLGGAVPGDWSRDSASGKPSLENVGILARAGVRVALAAPDDGELPDLLLLAACEVQHGLSPDAALRMVTRTPAELLGVSGRVGTLAPGRDADLLILSGDPLDARSQIERVLVDGRDVSPSAPAEASAGPLVAIRAGRILTLTHGEIENGAVLIRGGKIAGVSREPLLPPGAVVIDASHGVVMPGMIDAHSHLGLHADADPPLLNPPAAASGPATAKTRMVNAVDPNDPAFTEALRAGVTAVLLAPPTAGKACGQAALLKTADCRLHSGACEHRVLKPYAALCFNLLGGTPRLAQPWAFREVLYKAKSYLERRARYEREHRNWEQAWRDAEAGGKDLPREPGETSEDEEQEPFAALFRKQVPAFVHASRSDEILNALKVFSDEMGLEVVLVDAAEGYHVPAEILRRGAAAALGPEVTRWENGRFINNADALARAGVPLLFQTSATSGTQLLRMNAAYAVHHGLDPVEALRALTLNPARVLKVDGRLGSIETGKDADLVILDGDPLDLRSRVEKVLVAGKVVYDAR